MYKRNLNLDVKYLQNIYDHYKHVFLVPLESNIPLFFTTFILFSGEYNGNIILNWADSFPKKFSHIFSEVKK